MYKTFFKTIVDVIVSAVGFLVLSPIFIIVTICLYFSNDGKPFFFQLRPGKDGKIFKIMKFKTMNDKKDTNGELLPDAERLTKTGKFVRKTSLDELPQLLNVLKGDMSLVGPRPLLPEYLLLYNDFQKQRHNVKPGITGWAQINGRNAISWEDKFNLDVWYVQHLSALLDLKIILRTIRKVVKSEDITAANSVTIDRFNGGN
ncbi:sugar transferase [Flavobacterium sp. UW10123]|uniref:sugar transferase n=1 Tax=Flavobacterium sp. UW10123 TaxID=3230800 RepID=UPI003391A1DB